MALARFIVLVEIVRRVIRPLTLSVRLTANIIAGHLLITLVSSPAYSVPGAVCGLILLGLLCLIVLETAVRLIQAYVFAVLSTLYFNELNRPSIAA